MQIPSYQIRNVLKVYSRQVSQGKILARTKGNNKTDFKDSVSISLEGKRRAIIDRVTDDIVDKIVTEGSSKSLEETNQSSTSEEITTYDKPPLTYSKRGMSTKKTEEFTYTSIDKANNKTSQTLSTVGAKFVPTQTNINNYINDPENKNGGQIS